MTSDVRTSDVMQKHYSLCQSSGLLAAVWSLFHNICLCLLSSQVTRNRWGIPPCDPKTQTPYPFLPTAFVWISLMAVNQSDATDETVALFQGCDETPTFHHPWRQSPTTSSCYLPTVEETCEHSQGVAPRVRQSASGEPSEHIPYDNPTFLLRFFQLCRGKLQEGVQEVQGQWPSDLWVAHCWSSGQSHPKLAVLDVLDG